MILWRDAYTEMGTFGRLVLPSGREVYTCERPWLANRESVSCIPEGVYTIRARLSNVVKRTSGGKYAKGWEVQSVPGRSYIMIHPGNTMDDVEGCILVGSSLGYVKGKWAVLNSRATFDVVMDELRSREDWLLEIRQTRAEYP
ncbi:MAG TPA: hypothetical protein DCZ13_02570 [Porticoccaceae bacterium]|nr:hypothetical protein [Porticoccaceae bacterium]